MMEKYAIIAIKGNEIRKDKVGERPVFLRKCIHGNWYAERSLLLGKYQTLKHLSFWDFTAWRYYYYFVLEYFDWLCPNMYFVFM